jgi:hypothetical protein
MTGLVRKATLFSACGLLLAGSAMAGLPNAGMSTVPSHIRVVNGNSAGAFDPLGNFTVTVRDQTGTPLQNVSVVLDFVACTDGKVCNATSQALGQIVDGVTKTVRSFTDVNGDVTFNVLGAAGIVPPKPAGPAGGCMAVLADGTNLGFVTAVYHDQNGLISPGVEGMNIVDASSVLGDVFFNGTYVGRSDFDGTGAPLSIVDFSFALTAALGTGGASAVGCSAAPYSSTYW